jgi:hypothetical protein
MRDRLAEINKSIMDRLACNEAPSAGWLISARTDSESRRAGFRDSGKRAGERIENIDRLGVDSGNTPVLDSDHATRGFPLDCSDTYQYP